MCGMCPSVIGGCDKIECGARNPVDENGNRRSHYMRWFNAGFAPCEHVLAEHESTCAIVDGGFCDCYDTDW